MLLPFGIFAVILLSVLPTAFAQQIIPVNETQPCFLNATATWHILENCNARQDPMKWVLSGWEWISGGYFTMILVTILIISVYAKYHEVIYVVYIGLVYLPIAYFVFPVQFVSWAIIMSFVGIGILIWYAMIRQSER